MTDDFSFASDNELGEPLLSAVQAIRSEPISEETLFRVEQRLLTRSPRLLPRRAPGGTQASLWRRWLVAGGMAATLLLVLCVAGLVTQQPSAWGQVVQAVSKERWTRLTLQKPSTADAEPEEAADVVLWFSGDRKIAATSRPQDLRWMNVPNDDAWSFYPKSNTIRRGLIDTQDNRQVQLLIALLGRLDAPLPKKRTAGWRLVDSEHEKVSEQGQEWDRFTFQFEDSDAAKKRMSFIIRVDRTTHRPVDLEIRHGEKGLPLTFAIDYPEQGPDDIYALGAPRDARFLDARDVEKYFPPTKRPTPSDYEAIVLHFPASKAMAQIVGAERIRYNAGGMLAERAGPESVFQLTQDVHEGRKGPSKTPPSQWWAEEVDRLAMDEIQISESNAPHGKCYMAYGGARDYDEVRESDGTLPGLEQTLELRGPRLGVWLDPQRDMIVRRYENVSEDGTIDVWQYDEVVQGPNGVWFPTRYRKGCVHKRGAPLDNDQPTSGQTVLLTTVELKFQQRSDQPGR